MAELATFWETAAHLVNHFLLGIMSICNSGCFHFGIEGGTVVLIAPVPGHCLPIALQPDMVLGRCIIT